MDNTIITNGPKFIKKSKIRMVDGTHALSQVIDFSQEKFATIQELMNWIINMLHEVQEDVVLIPKEIIVGLVLETITICELKDDEEKKKLSSLN